MRRVVMLGLVLALGGWSCASGRGQSATGAAAVGGGASSATAEAPDPLADFTGIWRGRSISTASAASAKISFIVKREGNRLKGDYRCAPGNAICRDNIQRGWVNGEVSGRGFRVEMEDSSWCMYYMDEFYPPKADGEYTCYQSGMIADQGTFKLIGPPTPSD